MGRKKMLTPQEAREAMKRQGIPIARWARANGVPVRAVYEVLLGRNRGCFGTAHKVAVLLGIKEGEIEHVA